MDSTYKRMIELYNQMDCPFCGQKLNVSFLKAENEGVDVVSPQSSCCKEGSQYAAEIFEKVYQQALFVECAEIINMP